MKVHKSNSTAFILYLIFLLFAVFSFQDYFLEPQSIHHWRQSDAASLTLNYYHHGMNFFQPEIHFYAADSNSSGYGVGEFPILYYLTAWLYHIFGPATPILRGVHAFIFFTGLIYLYKGIRERYQSRFWAFFIPSMILASPVILFYSANYLPNTPALGLVFIAWYHIHRYQQSKNAWHIWYMAFFFCFAGLLKLTALLSFVPIFGLAIISFMPWKQGQFFKHPFQACLAFFGVLLANIAWYRWAIAYNTGHKTGYFSTHTWPYNSLDEQTKKEVWNNIFHYWGDDYFYPAVYVFLVIVAMIFLKNLKKLSLFWVYLLSTLSVGLVIFGYLFFLNLKNHDYYTINLYIIPLLLMVAVLDFLKHQNHRLFRSKRWKFALLVLMILSIRYGGNNLEYRYTGWQNDMRLYSKLDEGIQPFLREQGIGREDKFLVVGDFTPNTALHRMDQKGWTDLYGDTQSEERVQNLLDHKGLSYMVVLDDRFFEEKPFLRKFSSKIKAEYKGLKIYDLR